MYERPHEGAQATEVIAYGAGVESESFVVDAVVVIGGADAGGGGGMHSSVWGVGDGASPEGVDVRKIV
jgi:hypothetical protein